MGSFSNAQNFGIWGSHFYDISYQSENFMKEFANEIIPGAAYDSSERDPPPRCHPGTRLNIVERAVQFFGNQDCNTGLLWLVGPAGVGKSAIMQTLAEVPSTPDFTLGASLFFSINGRANGLKAIATLAYQIAVKLQPYRDFVENEVANDPTLFEKAIISQFNKLIVEPFVIHGIRPEGHKRLLVLIDGLDECEGQHTQRVLLGLISYFSLKYPAAPLVWVVASRPEPHITHFLSRPSVLFSYVKEEIKVDNDESCKDVERYLHKELENIQAKYPALALFPRWPRKHDFLKIAAAARGLFAYGTTVIKYIDDPIYATPTSRLQQVLEIIDGVHSQVGWAESHPMANLDALYSRILSLIPRDALVDTKKLLLLRLWDPLSNELFHYLPVYCGWLGMKPDAVYGSLHHLHSVLNIPPIKDAFDLELQFHHKSFPDFLKDYNRSGMFLDFKDEADKLCMQCIVRILNEISKARQKGLHPSAGISSSWLQPNPEDVEGYKKQLYGNLLFAIVCCLPDGDLRGDLGLVHALKHIDIQFALESYDVGNARYAVSDGIPCSLFNEPGFSTFKELHIFKEFPIRMLDMKSVAFRAGFHVHLDTKQHDTPPRLLPGRWCKHHQRADFRCPGGDLWFRSNFIAPFGDELMCNCFEYVREVLEHGKSQSPDHLLTTFVDVTGSYGWIYYEFDDPENELSWWKYIFLYQF